MVSLTNARRQGKQLTIKQKRTLGLIPSWQTLTKAIEEKIEKYNSLHKHSELHDMFLPEEIRTAARGWIHLGTNDYFAKELIEVD